MNFYRVNNEFLHANTTVVIDGSVLRIQWQNLNNPQQEPTIGDVSLDFVELKERSAFADHTLWVLLEATKKWVPIFSETSSTKESMGEFAQRNGNFIACLFVPLANNNLDDCFLSVAISENSELTFSGEISGQGDSHSIVSNIAFPKLEIGEPIIENGIASFSIILKDYTGTTLNESATVYCESTIGALLTNRVELNNGLGTIKLNVNGLDGLTGKVKVGFKFYTGVSEKYFTV